MDWFNHQLVTDFQGFSGGGGQNGWFIMENPMNKWMIWGENPLFSETSIYGHHIWKYLVSGFHPYLGGPKTYRSVPWTSIEPCRTTSSSRRPDCISSWTRIMKLEQILSTCSWWLDWWVVILIGKAVIFQEIHKGQKGKHHGRSLSRWWQLNYFVDFSSRTLGKMNPF